MGRVARCPRREETAAAVWYQLCGPACVAAATLQEHYNTHHDVCLPPVVVSWAVLGHPPHVLGDLGLQVRGGEPGIKGQLTLTAILLMLAESLHSKGQSCGAGCNFATHATHVYSTGMMQATGTDLLLLQQLQLGKCCSRQ
jgi:hypothetical protein